jgi:hypothetical protein
VKLSERFDRRYQQTPLAVPTAPTERTATSASTVATAPQVSAAPALPKAAVVEIPVERRAQPRIGELSTKLSPALAAA